MGLQQGAFLLGLTGLALGSIALRERLSLASWIVLLVGVALTVFGVASIATLPARATNWRFVPYKPVCGGDPVPLCVHPAYSAELRYVVPRLERAMSPFKSVPGLPSGFAQGVVSATNFGRPNTLPQDPYAVWVDLDESGPGPFFAEAVANGLVTGSDMFPENEAQNAVKAWLLRRMGAGVECGGDQSMDRFTPAECEAADRFARLTPRQQHEWLLKNYRALQAGDLRLKALP